jgi:hypothetical protein
MVTVGMFPFFYAGRREATRRCDVLKEYTGVCYEVDGFESAGL